MRPLQPTRIGRSVRRSNNRQGQLKMRCADNTRVKAVMCARLQPTTPRASLLRAIGTQRDLALVNAIRQKPDVVEAPHHKGR